MKVTIKKIAEIAGVHPATVDKVLHNRPGVSDEVRERVRKLIDELGYKPNPAGRVLQKQGREFVIAAILVKVDALPYIKEGIEKGIREQTGLDITIHWYLSSYSDAGQQAQFIDKAVEEKADGIILSPINSNRVREAINRAAAAGIPLVTTNSDIDGTQRLCYVGQDGRRASRVAGRTMGNLLGGSGRIAIISSAIASENNSYHVKVREEGFCDFLRETFPDVEIIASVESFEDPEITYRETYNLLKKHPDLDGLYITCGGVSQVGRAIRDCGREDIKTLSFEKYPEILDLMQEDIIDCTIDSELERQGEIPVQVIMDELVLKKHPNEDNIFTDIRILIKECLF
ncbi:MAG: LacI family DNA-binding transcriptional regulator [Sarcina sp.]|nr:LacI family DNA-binding transcriptional regulator [Sarcina sp.]